VPYYHTIIEWHSGLYPMQTVTDISYWHPSSWSILLIGSYAELIFSWHHRFQGSSSELENYNNGWFIFALLMVHPNKCFLCRWLLIFTSCHVRISNSIIDCSSHLLEALVTRGSLMPHCSFQRSWSLILPLPPQCYIPYWRPEISLLCMLPMA